MTKITDDIKLDAIRALYGMRLIINREMLMPNQYVSQRVDDPAAAASGALCGGRKMCAVGSLWVGGGVKIETRPGHGRVVYANIPGTNPEQRKAFLKGDSRKGLRLAYKTMNKACKAYGEAEGLDMADYDADDVFCSGGMEVLFERHEAPAPVLLRLIDQAVERIERA